MQQTTKQTTGERTTRKGSNVAAGGTTDIEQFAYHISEALRLARTSPSIPVEIYNELGEVTNEYIASRLDHDSPEVIALALRQHKGPHA